MRALNKINDHIQSIYGNDGLWELNTLIEYMVYSGEREIFVGGDAERISDYVIDTHPSL